MMTNSHELSPSLYAATVALLSIVREQLEQSHIDPGPRFAAELFTKIAEFMKYYDAVRDRQTEELTRQVTELSSVLPGGLQVILPRANALEPQPASDSAEERQRIKKGLVMPKPPAKADYPD